MVRCIESFNGMAGAQQYARVRVVDEDGGDSQPLFRLQSKTTLCLFSPVRCCLTASDQVQAVVFAGKLFREGKRVLFQYVQYFLVA